MRQLKEMRYLTVILLLVGCTVSAAEPQCQPFNHSTIDQCTSLINYPLWTDPEIGITQESIRSNTQHLYTGLPLMDYNCAVAYLTLLCPTNYQPCIDGYPIPICHDQCAHTNRVCANFFARYGLPSINCDQLNPITGYPLWPTDNCTIYRECTHGRDTYCILNKVEYSCPSPLVFIGPDRDAYTGLPCASTCSDKLRLQYSDPHDFDRVFIMVSVLNWISLVCVIIVCLVYAIYPTMRKMPRRVILFIGVGMMIEHLALAINSMQGVDSLLCEDLSNLSTEGWARGSAWMLIFGAMIAASWWMIESLILFYNIGLLRVDNGVHKYEYMMHIWCWGYPLIASLIFMFVPHGDGLGATEGIPWAFNSWLSNDALTWALFYGIIILYILLFLIFTTITIGRLIIIHRARQQSPLRRRKFQLSLGIFTVVFFIIATIIVANRSWNVAHEDDIQTGVMDWYACVLTWNSDCKVSYHLNDGLVWTMAFGISVQGLALFVIFFCLSASVYRMVWKSINNLIEGRGFHEDLELASVSVSKGSRYSRNSLSRSNSASSSTSSIGGSRVQTNGSEMRATPQS